MTNLNLLSQQSWQNLSNETLINENGYWLHNESNKVVTYFDDIRLSSDSNVQQTEHTFPDSCESLTVFS